jgi:hypothetical protein
VLAFLFIASAILVMITIYFSMLDAHVMPWSCPACYHGADEDIAGGRRHWYLSYGDHVRCRWCGASFKEHPDGSIVRDRDG